MYAIIYLEERCQNFLCSLCSFMEKNTVLHLQVLVNIDSNFSDGNYEYSKRDEHGTLIDPTDTSDQVTT